MRRRAFIAGLGSAAVWSLSARAQPSGRMWTIGILEMVPERRNRPNVEALRRGLLEHGYVEGQNLRIEYRSADGHDERFPRLAAELIAAGVDLIVTRGTPAAKAAKATTSTVPIVMAAIGDPLGVGIVASLAHPGGNITGLSAFIIELAAKRVELLNEGIPGCTRMAFLHNMDNPAGPRQWIEVNRAATSLHIETQLLDIRSSTDIEPAFGRAAVQRAQALLVGNDTLTIGNRRPIVELAAQHRLPAMYNARTFVDAGGLMTYGVSFPDLYRRAATLVDEIFHGARPADLPVEQPTKFELVINLKAAKALGLHLPPTFLARADEVIE